MSEKEKAVEVAAKAHFERDGNFNWAESPSGAIRENCLKDMDAAITALEKLGWSPAWSQRDAALEEAAKVAETAYQTYTVSGIPGECRFPLGCAEVAALIRALKSKTQ